MESVACLRLRGDESAVVETLWRLRRIGSRVKQKFADHFPLSGFRVGRLCVIEPKSGFDG